MGESTVNLAALTALNTIQGYSITRDTSEGTRTHKALMPPRPKLGSFTSSDTLAVLLMLVQILDRGIDKLYYYRANSSRNAIIRANRPVASARANPRIAYENS